MSSSESDKKMVPPRAPSTKDFEREQRFQSPAREAVDAHGRYEPRDPSTPERPDVQLEREVRQALERSPELDAKRIELSVDGGVVTLRGSVPDADAKRLAEDLVNGLGGVRRVENIIAVEAA
jgi:osmotically-inducible protein OsmY